MRGVVLGNKVILGSVNSNVKHFQRGVSDMLEVERRKPGLLKKFITSRKKPEEYREVFQRGANDVKVVIEFWERTSY